MRLDGRKHRVSGAIEDLNGSHVTKERRMADEEIERLSVRHQCPWHLHLEVVEEMAHAVATVERATNNVVETQPGLAVLDHFCQRRIQLGTLVTSHDRQVPSD